MKQSSTILLQGQNLVKKDYYLTLILYFIRNVEGIYFKGGTALNKIFLNHAGLSEDLDFSLTRNEKEVKDEISKNVSFLEGNKKHDKFTILSVAL